MTVQRTRWRLLTAHTLTTKQHCQFANFWRDRIQRSTIEKLVDLDLDRVFFQRSMISISIALQRSIDRGRSRSRVDRGISAFKKLIELPLHKRSKVVLHVLENMLFPYWNFFLSYTVNLLTFVEGQNIKGIRQQNNRKGQRADFSFRTFQTKMDR